MEPSANPAPPVAVQPLDANQRRVLGVLVEKAFCTPDQYPLTANSVVVACNQKSNRDPVTNLPADVVDDALLDLQRLGLVTRVLPATGRTERWRHQLKDAWRLERAERAILAELLLRGPQSEGELRGRASRMVNIATLEELHVLLDRLAERGFVRRMSPDGRKRGVIWSHLLYRPDEWSQIERRIASDAADADSDGSAGNGAVRSSTGIGERIDELVLRLEQLASDVEHLKERVAALETKPRREPEDV